MGNSILIALFEPLEMTSLTKPVISIMPVDIHLNRSFLFPFPFFNFPAYLCHPKKIPKEVYKLC
jgi:hypothetical protein